MLNIIKSIKDYQNTPIVEIVHNDGDQVLAYSREDLIFVFNFNPVRSFTDYGFLTKAGTYEVILNTDSKLFGGFGLADDTVKHFTLHDPLYEKEKKEWLKLYLPARSAMVLKRTK
jgi:1,4-alpha-glucan branching enzyme